MTVITAVKLPVAGLRRQAAGWDVSSHPNKHLCGCVLPSAQAMTAAQTWAAALSGGCRNSRNPPRRAHVFRRKYHCPFGVVSKCALRDSAYGAAIVSVAPRQPPGQMILKLRQSYRRNLRQNLFENRSLLNKSAGSRVSFLFPVAHLCFLQLVLCLQELLFGFSHGLHRQILPS